jgi:GxxExxY protein
MNPTYNDIFGLCDIVRETSFSLHRFLRHGHLESVYENGLKHRLSKVGLEVKSQFPREVRDEDGTHLGSFYADLFVEDKLIVELKAIKQIVDAHVAQLLGYLRATGIQHGLIINFGSPKLEIRKYALT